MSSKLLLALGLAAVLCQSVRTEPVTAELRHLSEMEERRQFYRDARIMTGADAAPADAAEGLYDEGFVHTRRKGRRLMNRRRRTLVRDGRNFGKLVKYLTYINACRTIEA